MKKSTKDYSSNPFYNDERAVKLRTFLDSGYGNSSKLSQALYGNRYNSLSHYKYGRDRIGDKVWRKIHTAIDKIKSEENNSFASKKSKDAYIDQWIKTDNVVKMRLGNVAYALNYTAAKNLRSTKFWSALHIKDYTDVPFEHLQNIMNKVDSMIKNKHTFAVSARNN